MADLPVTDLAAPRTIHLVGVGGAGISAIGIILAAMGHHVTGSDVNETAVWPTLEASGVAPEVVEPADLFASAHRHGAEIVAHSTAFPPTRGPPARTPRWPGWTSRCWRGCGR